jgi:hypothetical protein
MKKIIASLFIFYFSFATAMDPEENFYYENFIETLDRMNNQIMGTLIKINTEIHHPYSLNDLQSMLKNAKKYKAFTEKYIKGDTVFNHLKHNDSDPKKSLYMKQKIKTLDETLLRLEICQKNLIEEQDHYDKGFLQSLLEAESNAQETLKKLDTAKNPYTLKDLLLILKQTQECIEFTTTYLKGESEFHSGKNPILTNPVKLTMKEKLPLLKNHYNTLLIKTESLNLETVKEFMKKALPDDLPRCQPEGFKELPYSAQFEWYVDGQLNLTNQDKRRLNRIFSLMAKVNIIPPFIDPLDDIIDPISLDELDIFASSGQDKKHSIMNNVDYTKLHIGRAVLGRHFLQIKKPENVQRLQKELVLLKKNAPQQSKPLYKLIRDELEQIKPLEDNFLSFYEEGYRFLGNFIERKEFKKFNFYNILNLNKKANNSPITVQIGQLWDFATPIMMLPISIGVTAASALSPTTSWMGLLGGSAFTYNSASGLPVVWSDLRLQVKALALFQRNLIGIVKFIEKLENFHQYLEKNNILPEIRKDLLIPTDTQEMKNLVELLKKDTFQGEESFFSHWGNILAAWRKMDENKDMFLKAYYTLGIIDFLTGLNELYDSQTANNPYCFGKFDKNENISIQAKGVWSPLLKQKEKAVLNDFIFGRPDHPKTGIITGSNANGKTFFMRALAGAALMVITLGIGPAQELSIPEMLNFLTSMNIADKPQNGLSLFAAVVERMAHIINTLKNNPDKNYLLINDEPFVGSSQTISTPSAATLIACVTNMKKVLALFTTHLDVTKLEQEFPKLIGNYHLNKYKINHGVDQNSEDYYAAPLKIFADSGLPEEFIKDFNQRLEKEKTKKNEKEEKKEPAKKSEKKPYTPEPTSPQEKPENKLETSYQHIPVIHQGLNSQCGYYSLRNGLIALKYGVTNQPIDTNDERFKASGNQQILETQTWDQLFPNWQQEIIKYRKKRALAAWIQEKIKPYIAEHDPILTKDYRSVLFNAAQSIANRIIESETKFESIEYTYKTLEDTIQQAMNASDKKVFLKQDFSKYLPNISKLSFQLMPEILNTELQKKYPNKTEDLDGDEIKHLLDLTPNSEQLKQNFTIIDDIEVAKLQENFDSAAEKWHNHDNSMHIFLLGTMSQNYSTASGHWYMVATQKINGQKTIFTADSLNIDRTKDPRVQKLIEKLNEEDKNDKREINKKEKKSDEKDNDWWRIFLGL